MTKNRQFLADEFQTLAGQSDRIYARQLDSIRRATEDDDSMPWGEIIEHGFSAYQNDEDFH